jgi:hypothetical protein
MMTKTAIVTALAIATLVPALAAAQQLPPPSRTVYKCNMAGKIVYSDDPCKGAEKLEIEPTRGIDSASGRKAVGADVQREKYREIMADALKPLTGMDAKQLDSHGRRQKLPKAAQHECGNLDRAIVAAERQEAQVAGKDRVEVQDRLFQQRQRFRELRC